MLKTVIFDLDGVLIDSEPLMRAAFAITYESVLGSGVPPTEEFLGHMGESFPHIMDRLGLPHTLWKPYKAFCQQNIDRIKLFPDTVRILTWALDKRLILGLLTGKDRVRTIQILEHFELLKFFSKVLASDELKHPKPHPEGVLRLLESLNSQPEETVVIGDSVNDITSAQRANVTAIAVTWGIKPELVLSLSQPDYVATDSASLLKILEQLMASRA